jgi:hypothetical protein
MDAARWQRIETILNAALERSRATRGAFLGEACAGDVALRSEIENLILQHEADPDFLDRPLVDLTALFTFAKLQAIEANLQALREALAEAKRVCEAVAADERSGRWAVSSDPARY